MLDAIGKLTKPITKLLDVIADACGTLYEPTRIERKALAQAKAAVISAESKEQVALITQRTQIRLKHQEHLRQENIETISAIALNELPGKVSSDPVDLDWTMQFFDYAKDVNDEDMQILWGRILAGEVARPGSYSKRTIEFLKTIEKWEAEAFSIFCAAAIQFESGQRVIIYSKPYDEYIQSKFGRKRIEEHFIAIGLLTPEHNYLNIDDQNSFTIKYFSKIYEAVQTTNNDSPIRNIKPLRLGVALRHFSLIGQQLAEIAGAKPIPKFIELISADIENEHTFRFEARNKRSRNVAKKIRPSK